MMYQNGDLGEHGYLLCAKESLSAVKEEAKKECIRRGNKYEPFLLTLNDAGFVKTREKII